LLDFIYENVSKNREERKSGGMEMGKGGKMSKWREGKDGLSGNEKFGLGKKNWNTIMYDERKALSKIMLANSGVKQILLFRLAIF
jgi:hypothetical protein